MYLYLVRHARTHSNRAVVYAGRSNEPVLASSYRAIGQVTRYIVSQKPGRVVSSPLPRAVMTAEPLAHALGVILEIEPDLTEMNLGPWTGLKEQAIKSAYPAAWVEWRNDPFAASVDGMECLGDVQARAVEWMERTAADGIDTAVVTHESVIKAIMCSLHPYGEAFYRRSIVTNCSVQTLRFEAPIWSIAHVNSFRPTA